MVGQNFFRYSRLCSESGGWYLGIIPVPQSPATNRLSQGATKTANPLDVHLQLATWKTCEQGIRTDACHRFLQPSPIQSYNVQANKHSASRRVAETTMPCNMSRSRHHCSKPTCALAVQSADFSAPPFHRSIAVPMPLGRLLV